MSKKENANQVWSELDSEAKELRAEVPHSNCEEIYNWKDGYANALENIAARAKLEGWTRTGP